MDVFALRDQLVADYEAFTRSFIHVSDDRIREVVDRELAEGLLWPESLIQLNPSFQAGLTIDDLVAEGVLHEANRAIFRRGRRWDEHHPVSESIPQDELFRSTGVRP